MKAIVKPERVRGLAIADVPIPDVAADEVLIEVLAAGICGSDLPIYDCSEEWVRRTVTPGQTIGHEFSGIVVDRGDRVRLVASGDFVTAEGHINCGKCRRCREGDGHICLDGELLGFDRPGAFAEYVSVPERNVVVLPRMRPAIGALQDPFGTAIHALSKVSTLGATVLVTGCGPIGLLAIALSRVAGAHAVVATDVSSYRLGLASRMGATTTVNVTEQRVEKIVASDYGNGMDVVIEASGSPEAVRDGLSAVRPGGAVLLLGLPSGEVELDLAGGVITRGVTIYGIIGRELYRTWYQAHRLVSQTGLESQIDLGRLITHELMLDDYETGFSLMRDGMCGKVILFPTKKAYDARYAA